jgi:P-type Ca2+ transporter type 2C
MAETTASQPKWYNMAAEAVEQQLKVDPAKGLSASEAQQRLQQYGPNQLTAKKKESGAQAFLRQYQDFMQIILVGAAVINIVVTGEWSTTIVLLVLTVFNAGLALRGEAKAEASLATLQSAMKNTTRVRRDGEVVEIDAEQVVPGDIVLLQAGDAVPADGRLSEAATLEIEESALTGESVASPKNTDVIDNPDASLGDRHNMAYMNTGVTRGSAEMIVTTTGMGTQMGSIATLLNKTESDKTPLQKQLDKLTIIIASLAGVAFIIMIILGIMNDESLDTVFIAGIALAIAAIPTGLPAVVTTMYSMGARVLAGEGAIVKRLPSVETLGSVSAVCTDKTGTLTLNKMTSVELTIPGHNHYSVTGEGYSTVGKLLNDSGNQVDLTSVLMPMALCADATLDGDELVGDPTEGALVVLAAKGGIDPDGIRNKYPRLAVLPFDAAYKFMATFHNMNDEQGKPVVRCFVKGAPDVVIGLSSTYWLPSGEVKPLTDEGRQVALDENERIGEEGERVMVVARRDYDPATFDPDADMLDIVKDLTLLGIVGIVDPPRAEAKDAIAKCHSAGIQVRMITGDHAVTAAAIGKQLGIEGKALTGAQFAAMSDEAATNDLDNIAIVARVTPQDKIRMVELLQHKENIVSMTGDGVNDAPALKKADIGVAMGITGTEVSKGAAVMILTDDNFATIIKAIEFGRGIYNNLFNFVRFQMFELAAFIISYLLAAFFLVLGGVPFTPALVLFVNFLVTVPCAIALGFDKAPPGLMENKPRPLKQPILNRSQWLRIVFLGFLTAIVTVYLESVYEATGVATATTMGFVAFALMGVAMGVSARRETGSSFNRDIIQDRHQLTFYGIAILFAFLPTELAFLQRFLGTTSLSRDQWLLCIGFAIALLVVDEVIKFFLRRSRQQEQPTVDVARSAPAALSGD